MTDHLIDQFSCLTDNFGVLLHNPVNGETISIDAPDAPAIEQRLAAHGWRLSHILVTHHHHDHTGGIEALKSKWSCRVLGPRAEASKIAHLDQLIDDGERLSIAGFQVHAIQTPGHTAGHLNFYLPEIAVAFTGDTLFALGCGRLFEGTPADMWSSMQKLRALPAETTVYCGHEYTLTNARYAVSIDPDNATLHARLAVIERQRQNNEATLPTTIGAERTTNPFMRADDPVLQAAMNMTGGSAVAVFTALREGKDNF